MNGDRRRRGGGWIHLWFAIFLGIGAFTYGAHQHTTDPVEEPAVTRNACEGVPYTPDEDSAVQSLVDAGWFATGSKVYPPECGRG
jgi:hypothetical protein